MVAIVIDGPIGCSRTLPKSGNVSQPDEDQWRKETKSVEGKVNVIHDQVVEEAQQLGKNHWAGLYYQGDGLGVNIQLDIAPKAGFAFEWQGCLGLYDRNYGTVKEDNGRLKLSFGLSNVREGFHGLAEEFMVVPWGQRMYLIEVDHIYDFCDWVNIGMEPRDEIHGLVFLREGDEKVAVTGRPSLPNEYQPYLSDTPILAEIMKVISTQQRGWIYESTVEINAGREQGVLSFMRFHESEELHSNGFVKEVLDNRSIVVFTESKVSELPVIGTKVSTIPKYYNVLKRRPDKQDAK